MQAVRSSSLESGSGKNQIPQHEESSDQNAFDWNK